jgi:sec-independent protein translocase protein TatB
MLGNLGFEKLGVLLVVALIVLGPERLPKLAADAARMLRQLRRMAQNASSELKDELGPEFADLHLSDLHPRRFVQRHLLTDEEDQPAGVGAGSAVGRVLAPGESPPFDPDAT